MPEFDIIVIVQGGVVSCTFCNDNIKVGLIDHDNEPSDSKHEYSTTEMKLFEDPYPELRWN